MSFREDLKPDRLLALEEEILAVWREEETFQETLARRKDAPRWVFYEGPPTANGRPGVHHVLARAVKDFACRLRTMQGYLVDRKAGWDTHGLPVEIEAERRLGLEGKGAIEELGIARFNEECRASVLRYLEDWNALTRRMGYWVDLDHPYITYNRDYMETLWWILATFHEKGLLFKGHKVLPYCPRCATPLSSHEVGQGFKDVQDPSVTVRFQREDGDGAFLVWTTTPWTLPANVAIAANPLVDYVQVQVMDGPTEGELIWLAKDRLSTLKVAYEVQQTVRGKDLVGTPVPPAHRLVPGRGGRPRLHRSSGRLRHDGGRHRVRAHRARLRPGRQRPRSQGGPARPPPRRRRRALPPRLTGRGRLRQGRRQGHPSHPQGRGEALGARGRRARLPALLALRHAAPLLRARVLVPQDDRLQGRNDPEQRRRHVGAGSGGLRATRAVARGEHRLGDLA